MDCGGEAVSDERELLFDSAGLGYSLNRGSIFVHYPKRDESGALVYGAGFNIEPLPPKYFTEPQNPATTERVAIWKQLREVPALRAVGYREGGEA